ncbi:hypothetical protein GPJ56_004635 [Histomonas meleagridis]|uniref:uncharacterized protein n=1 Tax=Histomonas meleagridis TaxID=135588 RepID=UPI00355A22D3|nr:hypothetical protein GPJ56_004635 [Histomonas meleagridis]KAH0797396.1 hypothetical protein GO595_009717 [Histomonas meleagridis]
MKSNTPIKEESEPKAQQEEKPVISENHANKMEIQTDETISKVDEQYERTKPLYETRKSSIVYDILVIGIIIGIVAFVWAYVYKNPIPFAIKRLLGMDDTVYPEMYEKMRQEK